MIRVLIVDSSQESSRPLKELLQTEGFFVDCIPHTLNSLQTVMSKPYDIVITDIGKTADIAADIRTVKAVVPEAAVIALSSDIDPDGMRIAFQAGAADFLKKPVRFNDLLDSIKKMSRKTVPEKPYEELITGFISASPSMKALFEMIRQIAPTQATVLINGETGTGKELVATAIHELSSRANNPIVKINCAALPESLLESELFGYEKGAFTGAVKTKIGKFEFAHGGTIFLDEIGEMSLPLQAKLLRVLQEREIERVGSNVSIGVDVRIIAATNQDLRAMIKEKRFRDDLYYRLNVINVHIPPLRERSEDIPILAGHFLKQFNEQYNKHIEGFSTDVTELFSSFAWDGNIRELRNLVESCVILTRDRIIRKEHLPYSFYELATMNAPDEKEPNKQPSRTVAVTTATTTAYSPLEEAERLTIIRELEKADGNKAQTARNLGVTRKTLYEKLAKYGISIDEP